MKKILELHDLTGRSAIVTGGGGHLGLAVCETLMELGAQVAVMDIDQETCDQRCEALNLNGYIAKAIPIPVDLAVEKKIRKAVRDSSKKMGGLDILIHCAALTGDIKLNGWITPFESQATGAWDAAMNVNLRAAFVLSQEAARFLKKSVSPSIIFISSIYGVVAPDLNLYKGTQMGNPAAYGVSKAVLIQFAKYLSTVLAPKIRVNVISPGGIWRNQKSSFHSGYKTRTPLRRMATEEDLKGAVAYFASNLSRYVTGQNLVVDGGYTVW